MNNLTNYRLNQRDVYALVLAAYEWDAKTLMGDCSDGHLTADYITQLIHNTFPTIGLSQDPNHDSIHLKFEQLNSLLDIIINSKRVTEKEQAAVQARQLINLIRIEVLV